MTDNPEDIALVERTVAFYQPDLLEVRGPLAGMRLPVVTEPRCKVCNHPERIYLENATHAGYHHSQIIAGLQDDRGDITWRNVRDHFKRGHVPISKTDVLETLWRKAEEHGITPEEYSATQEAHIEALDLVVDKFLARLKDPTYVPDMPDGLRAIKMKQEIAIAGDGGVFNPNDMFVALSLFMNHIQTIMVEYLPAQYKEAMSDLRRLLGSDPILKNLIEKAKVDEPIEVGLDRREDEQVEDAVVVEEDPALPSGYVPPEDWEDDDEIDLED